MHIHRIRLENWRNFRRVDVPLQTRVFLAGPNAAGKTNFLDVFRFLKDLAQAGFQKTVEKRGGVPRIRCLSARHPASVLIDVNFTSDDGRGGELDWRYRIAFSQEKTDRPILESESVWKGTDKLLSRPNSKDKRDEVRLSQSALEQTAENEGFRDIVALFRRISYCHPIPHVIRESKTREQVAGEEDVRGSTLLRRILSSPERTRNFRLKLIQNALKIAVPHLHELEIVQSDKGTPHLLGRYAHWRLHDAQHSEREFSDGALRLIAILWNLLEGEKPLLLEEPELFLHPGFVRELAPILQRMQRRKGSVPRQAIYSTHSSDLISGTKVLPEEILLFIPGRETTDVTRASSLRDARDLLESKFARADEDQPPPPGEDEDQLDMSF